MIKLRLVGPSDDLHFLVYSASRSGKRGSHLVEVDEDLFDVLEALVRERRREARGEREKPKPKPKAVPRVESKLAPKDVQRLLRSGRTVDQVAKTAGVPVAWVEQFLGVVQYERIGIVNEVRRSWMEKQRLGASGAPVGESVEINLRARHVRLTDQELAEAWDAFRIDDQPWVVSLTFRFRGRAQKATWKFDPTRRELTPANRLAADLGWVAPGRRMPPKAKESRVITAKPARKAGGTKTRSAGKRKTGRSSTSKTSSRRAKPTRKTKPAKRATPRRKTSVGKKKKAASRRSAVRRPARRSARRR